MQFSYRRFAVLLAALIITLGTVQVVLAALPVGDFDISDSVPAVGQSVDFTARDLSDPDGGTPTSVSWDFGDGATATGTAVSHTYLAAGAQTVKMIIEDPEAAEPPTVVAKTLRVDARPTASFTCSPSSVIRNQAMTCTAAASSDPEGALFYSWDSNGGGAGTDQVEQFSWTTIGTKTITLTVTDSNGSTAVTQRTVTVVNLAPNAELSVSPNPALIGENVVFEGGTSRDRDGSITTYQWDLDGVGGYEISGPSSRVNRSYSSAGTRTVRLIVTDNNNATNMVSRRLVVQETRPNARFRFTPQAPLPAQAVTFTSQSTASGSPGDPRIINTEWDFNYDPAQDFAPDATGATATTSFPTAGPKTVAIKVTETGGGFAIVSGTLVVNAPPQASFNVAPATPLDGDGVTLSSTSIDPDGPLSAQQWDLDGDGQYDDASGAVASRAFAKGSHTVRLQVTDTKGATAVAESRIEVLKRPAKLLSGVKVTLFGNLTQRGVSLKGLLVRTPAKATAKVTCKGRKCPRGVRAAAKRATKTKRLRFKTFERSFPAGTLITVTVTRPGYIGQYTTIKVRKGSRRYVRRDRCLPPGGRKPIACPDS